MLSSYMNLLPLSDIISPYLTDDFSILHSGKDENKNFRPCRRNAAYMHGNQFSWAAQRTGSLAHASFGFKAIDKKAAISLMKWYIPREKLP